MKQLTLAAVRNTSHCAFYILSGEDQPYFPSSDPLVGTLQAFGIYAVALFSF